VSKELLTPDELGELFGVNGETIQNWRRRNGWPCVKVGLTVRFTPEQVKQIITQQTVTPRVPGKLAGPLPGQTKRSAARST
jgi:hypothetical protein